MWPRKAQVLFFFRTITCFSFLFIPCVDYPVIDRWRKRKGDCSGLRKVKTGRLGADNIMMSNNTLQSIVLGFIGQCHTPGLISSWRGIHNRHYQYGYLCNYRLATAGLWRMLWCATHRTPRLWGVWAADATTASLTGDCPPLTGSASLKLSLPPWTIPALERPVGSTKNSVATALEFNRWGFTLYAAFNTAFFLLKSSCHQSISMNVNM